MQATKICPHCKSEINAQAKKCPQCQSDLRNWFARHKILTALAILLGLPIIIGIASSSTKEARQKSAEIKNPAPASKTIQYEVIKQWEIPNGGKGEVIVIPSSYLNDADMTALGDKLKNDLVADRNDFIFVFTDKKAADLRDKVLSDKATAAEQKLYDDNFVATYTKNINTGYHKFQIMFGGVNGSNDKEITY